MRLLFKLFIISLVSGAVLAGFLKLIQIIFDHQAYILLFNMDYIPLLNHLDHLPGSGYVFHFIFCLVSVLALFYLATFVHLQSNVFMYMVVYGLGSGVLYFLTALTDKPPEVTSFTSWMFWVLAHLIFGLVVGLMIKYWMTFKKYFFKCQ